MTGLGWIVAVTFFASLGTGVLWNGIAFVAESAYGYGKIANFALSTTYGAAYVVAAFSSGRLIRALESRIPARRVLVLIFLAQALLAPLVLLPFGSWTLWVVGGLASALSAFQWPIIEAYLGAGRHRVAMRRAIGWWNVVWMSATALALVGIDPLLTRDLAVWAIVALLPTNLLCMLALRGFARVPSAHPDDPSDPVPPQYAALLMSSRALLPASYVVVGAISPLLPFLLGSIDAPTSTRATLAATWLFARVAAVALLWRTHGWQGRWATLLIGAILMSGGFGLAVLAPSLSLLTIGLAAFGLGQGTIYYAAIYYALAVGRSEIDAAGVHEGLIGIGYALGPIAGMIAFTLGSDLRGSSLLFVALIWSMLALLAIPAIRPYWRLRRRAAGLSS